MLKHKEDCFNEFVEYFKENPNTPLTKKLRSEFQDQDGSPSVDDVIALSTIGSISREQYRNLKRSTIVSDSFPTPNSVETRKT